MATRDESTPFVTRRGLGADVGTTSAWISTGRARRPSMATVTQVPLTACCERERKRPLGSGTSAMPSPVISKQPTSSVGPNRFFSERTNLSAVWRSPSKWHTTSTRCSSMRGPAMLPSLVTCPTRMSGRADSLHVRSSAVATSRTWLGPPASPSTAELATVCTESTMRRSGLMACT